MFQKPIVIVFFLCSFCINAQKKYYKSFYSNGQLKQEGWIKNNKKNGYWKFYYKNGNLEKEGHFIDNLQIKYWYFYARNTIKKKEGHFKNGLKNNWWLFYDYKGQLEHKCQLEKNQKNGFCFKYQENKLIKAEKYKSGLKIKEWTDLKSFKKENSLSDLYK